MQFVDNGIEPDLHSLFFAQFGNFWQYIDVKANHKFAAGGCRNDVCFADVADTFVNDGYRHSFGRAFQDGVADGIFTAVGISLDDEFQNFLRCLWRVF